jgi:hypothetical protein
MPTTAAATLRSSFVIRRNQHRFQRHVQRLRNWERPRARVAPLVAGRRKPVEVPVHLHPAELHGREVVPTDGGAAGLVAVTRDVSEHGASFAHDEPLHAPHAIAAFDLMSGETILLLVHITWTQKRQDSFYLSGGTFVGVVETVPQHAAS